MRRTIGVIVASLALAGAAQAKALPTIATGKAIITTQCAATGRDCIPIYQVRPSTIILGPTAGNDLGRLHSVKGSYLRWRTWGPTSASGVGTYDLNMCHPCSVGPYSPVPATVRAYRVRAGHFTRLAITYQADVGPEAHLVYDWTGSGWL
ncbi:MAG TPA: hypothetical protein VEF89_14640 [Solirubrobacteraceae bacterium]|nr:hypothetical protein [Solirubrobacteraceae bacterium]